MSLIVFKVVPRLNKWSVVHNDVGLATFATREEAERSAMALATLHPKRASAALDVVSEDGRFSEIRFV